MHVAMSFKMWYDAPKWLLAKAVWHAHTQLQQQHQQQQQQEEEEEEEGEEEEEEEGEEGKVEEEEGTRGSVGEKRQLGKDGAPKSNAKRPKPH